MIGEEEQAAGVFVEATDRGDDGIAAAPALGEERVDVGTFADVVGADEAEGFVEEKQETVGVVERRAVDLDVGGRGFLRGIVGGLAVDGDAAVVDPVTGLAAAAVAEVGEELVETAHAWSVSGRKEVATEGRKVAKEKACVGAAV